jgi:hypothetical protein
VIKIQKNGEVMFNLFRKICLLAPLTILSLNLSLTAYDDCCGCDPCGCDSNRMYIGAFGGGLFSDSTRITQKGTVFFPVTAGGPLDVLAKGHTKETSTGFGGVQAGYEWSSCFQCSDWSVATAAEVEAYFYSNKKRGHLINPTDRLPEHDFLDSFHMNMSVILANAVFSLNTPCMNGFILGFCCTGEGRTSLQLLPMLPHFWGISLPVY